MTAARVITIWQPHASNIMNGTKTVEQRSWATSHRGSLLIHAGVTTDPDEPVQADLPRGVILGRVTLVDVRRERADLYHWLLADPQPFDVPQPARGMPGLWTWTTP
jgi:hypothetical protein